MLWQYQQTKKQGTKIKDQENTKKQIQWNKTQPGAKNQNTKHKKSQEEESLELLSWGSCYFKCVDWQRPDDGH